MSQQPEEYAVHRLQAAKSAWYYLISFGRNGKLISKRFYDGRHGGQEAAYQAAIAWRDQMLKATPVLSLNHPMAKALGF